MRKIIYSEEEFVAHGLFEPEEFENFMERYRGAELVLEHYFDPKNEREPIYIYHIKHRGVTIVYNEMSNGHVSVELLGRSSDIGEVERKILQENNKFLEKKAKENWEYAMENVFIRGRKKVGVS